jgi:predicted Fe-Mo cluster-binding NifX family protein
VTPIEDGGRFMKIAVSSTGREIENLLDPRFGRCNYFVVYDTDNGSIKPIENKGQISSGGAGIAAAQQVIDECINTLITGNLGPNAFDLLKAASIKVYSCKDIKVKEAIELLNGGKLKELTEAGPSHPGAGAGNGNMYRGGR